LSRHTRTGCRNGAPLRLLLGLTLACAWVGAWGAAGASGVAGAAEAPNAAVPSAAPVAAPAEGVGAFVAITRGQLQSDDETTHAVQLPLKIYRPQRRFTRYRFDADFDVGAELAAQRASLRLDNWPDGGRITINGAEVADIVTSTEHLVVRHLRPYAFVLPPGLLRAGSNHVSVQWASRETLLLLPRLRVGPRALIEPQQERQLFWEHTAVQASLVFAAVVAVVMLGVWWPQRRRQAPVEYLLIGVSALGWLVFNSALFWTPIPVEWFLWRRVIGMAAIGLFITSMWVCLVRLAGWRSRRFEQLAASWIAVGPLLMLGGFVTTGATHIPWTEMLWSVGAASLGLVPLVVIVRAVWQRPSGRLAMLLAFVLTSVALAVREASIYVLKDPIGSVHLGLQVLAPLWLTTACGILVQDFVRSLRAADSHRDDLDRRLAAREAELAQLHARERERATDEERHRIMQDMHDGLGSQLVSSLVLAERGHLSTAQTAELLRGCIDDLRLAIDTLGDGDVDLALAAGNLRFRMEPRLRAAGLRLRWDMNELPDTLSLPGAIALPVLRVLQEALANAVKHARANTVQVRLACRGHELWLEVADDGQGFDRTQPAPGKGLSGMLKRARALHGDLQLDSSAAGTRVQLRLPLPPAAAPGRAWAGSR
jgi:signal transduction histidine kinase